jgi:hypothetical protein
VSKTGCLRVATALLVSVLVGGASGASSQALSVHDRPGSATPSKFDTPELTGITTRVDAAAAAIFIERLRRSIEVELDPVEVARQRMTLATVLKIFAREQSDLAEAALNIDRATAVFAASNLKIDLANALMSKQRGAGLGWGLLQSRGVDTGTRLDDVLNQILELVSPVSGYSIYIEARCARGASLDVRTRFFRDLLMCGPTSHQDEDGARLYLAGQALDGKNAYDLANSLTQTRAAEVRIFQAINAARLNADDKARLTAAAQNILALNRRLRAVDPGVYSHLEHGRAIEAGRIRDALDKERAQVFDLMEAVYGEYAPPHLPEELLGAVTIIAPVMLDDELGIVLAADSQGDAVSIPIPGLTPELLERLTTLSDQLSAFGKGQSDSLLRMRLDDWTTSYSRRDFRAAVDSFVTRYSDTLGVAIRQGLNKVGAKKGSRVTLIVDGPLSVVPLGLLRGGAPNSLIEDYELSISPNLESLAKSLGVTDEPTRRSVAHIVQDQGGPEFASVDGRVLESVARQAGVSARELEHSELARLSQSSYWHFASHGSFDAENPFQSGLQLSDNRVLTVLELQRLASQSAPPRLVFLSACETALIDLKAPGDDFIGFPGALLGASATGFIGSLWPVDDIAATLISAQFYRLHFLEGLRPSEALRSAQLWLRSASNTELLEFVQTVLGLSVSEEERIALEDRILELDVQAPFAHPVFWGGWVLYGQ